jgi:hypothetical protein
VSRIEQQRRARAAAVDAAYILALFL